MVLRNVLPAVFCFTYVTQDTSKSCVQHIWSWGAENLQHAQILCPIIQVLVEIWQCLRVMDFFFNAANARSSWKERSPGNSQGQQMTLKSSTHQATPMGTLSFFTSPPGMPEQDLYSVGFGFAMTLHNSAAAQQSQLQLYNSLLPILLKYIVMVVQPDRFSFLRPHKHL